MMFRFVAAVRSRLSAIGAIVTWQISQRPRSGTAASIHLRAKGPMALIAAIAPTAQCSSTKNARLCSDCPRIGGTASTAIAENPPSHAEGCVGRERTNANLARPKSIIVHAPGSGAAGAPPDRPIDRSRLGVVDGVTVCVPNIGLADRSGRTRPDTVASDADLISCGPGLHAA
jgi:hypothetical protein